MSRRRVPYRKWHVGDRALLRSTGTYLERLARMGIATLRYNYTPATVVAVRGDRVVVRVYGHEKVVPCWDLVRARPKRQRWWA